MRARWMWLAGLLVGIGCGAARIVVPAEVPPSASSPAAATDPDRRDPVAEATVDSPAPPDDDAPKLELLDPGAEPREVLRYTFHAGDRVRARVVSTMRLTQPQERLLMDDSYELQARILGVSTRGADVVIEYDVDTRTGAVTAPGDGPPPGGSARIQAYASVLSNGRVESIRFEIDGKPDPEPEVEAQIRTVVTTMVAATWLPEAPVGRGARWKITSRDVGAPIAIELIREVVLTLESAPKGKLVLRREVTQRLARPQTVSQGGSTRTVLAQDTTGLGTLHYDLTAAASFLPRKVEASIDVIQRTEKDAGVVSELHSTIEERFEVLRD